MAEATPHPALPSTADTVPYVPVSWMAVAAAATAGLFVVVLLALGLSAFVAKKPLVIPELLIFAVAGLVLSFAARRMIRNSEGTRTGDRLANAAWWTSLLVGLGYAAYLFGVDFSVRRDAQDEVRRWVGYLTAPDAKQTDINRAFIRTLDPGRRGPLNPDDTGNLQALFPDFVAFSQNELVRVVRRNPGACEYSPGGVKDWVSKPGLIECSVVGTLKCPEGTFPIDVPLRGFESMGKAESVGRQWQVVHAQASGFSTYVVADKVARTPYGWLVAYLEQSGGQAGREFVQRSGTNSAERAYLYHFAINPEPQPNPVYSHGFQLLSVVTQPLTRVDTRLLLLFTKEYQTFIRDKFVRLPGGGELSADKRAQFARCWHDFGLLAPGRRLPNNEKIDAHDVLTVTPSAVEVRVPCEIPLSGGGGNLAAARGRVVMSCDDPGLLADLKRLREEARPDQGTTSPPDGFRGREVRWRIVAVETAMAEVQVQRERGPGMSGGTGMPGDG